ncbi:MAG: hypothetical protein EA397_02775 [Deltaproteobacteria bacterium]|nr:MAG: hypothetical protein EA397_02775 [Deltaproteobacteria bacterium]
MSILLLLRLCLSPAWADEPDEDSVSVTQDLIERVRSAQEQVSALRDLPFKRDVRIEVESPEAMREAMREDLDEQLEDGQLEDLVFIWSLLDMAPADLDLYEVYLGVLQDAVGGYYNAETQRLVVVDRSEMGLDPKMLALQEDLVIAHELVHALQDQHFGLRGLNERELNNSDARLAVLSLIEGDANYAMLYRAFPNPDQVPLANLGPMLESVTGASESMFGPPGQIPRALTSPLIFPYNYGLVFAQHVKLSDEGWDAVNRALVQPPLSSEQILHPEKYVGPNPDWPTLIQVKRPERWLGPRWTFVDEDTLGEAGIALVMSENFPEADHRSIARGWDGDRLLVWRRGEVGALAWITTWDSDDDAQEFAEAAWELGRKLSPDATWTREPTQILGEHGSDRHLIQVRGHDVTVLFGIPKQRLRRTLRRVARTTYEDLTEIDQLATWEPPEDDTETTP